MQAAIDASVSDLKESMVEFATGAVVNAENCSHELVKAELDCSRHSAPLSGGSTTTSAPVG